VGTIRVSQGKYGECSSKLTSDLEAHHKATAAAFPKVVEGLVSIVGRKLTAYIASVKDARAVDRWIANTPPATGC
jgi:hypothetical protein